MFDTELVLGRRIRELRTHRPNRMTQEDLAARALISVSFVAMIERGQRMPHMATVVALANALEVSLSELFAGFDRKTPDLLRPIVDFCHTRELSRDDVERLLVVAKALFCRKNEVEPKDGLATAPAEIKTPAA